MYIKVWIVVCECCELDAVMMRVYRLRGGGRHVHLLYTARQLRVHRGSHRRSSAGCTGHTLKPHHFSR